MAQRKNGKPNGRTAFGRAFKAREQECIIAAAHRRDTIKTLGLKPVSKTLSLTEILNEPKPDTGNPAEVQ